MKPSVGSNCVFRVFPGERERVAPLSPPVPRGDVGERSAPRPRRRKQKPSGEQPASPGTKISTRTAPGERERVATLSHPVGSKGAERPTLVSSETASTKEQPASSGTNISTRTAPGERERVTALSHPVTRGGVGERSAPRSRRRKQRPQKNSLLRRKPKSPSEQPRESSRGCEPSRLPIEAGDLRGGKVACPKGKQVASRPTKRNRRFRLVAPGR